jgi:truncated hemoglobin YjbI
MTEVQPTKGREERVTFIEIQQRPERFQGIASTLFDRIGGLARIEALVDGFIDKLRLDPELATALAAVDVASFRKAQAAFLVEALGGHYPDGRVDSRRVHVELEGEHFIRAMLFLHDALAGLGLSAALHEQVVAAVIAYAVTEGPADA